MINHSVLKRKQSTFEDKYCDTFIQLAVEICSEPSKVQHVINNIVNTVVPLHTSKIGDEFTYKGPVDVLKIPSSIKNISDSCDWIFQNRKPDEIADATLGFNDRFIALSSQHRVCDGGYFKWVVNLIQNSFTQLDSNSDKMVNERPVPREWKYLPIASDNIQEVHEQLKKLPKDLIYNKKSETSLLVSKVDKKNLDIDKKQFVKAITCVVDAKKTQIYDPVSNKVNKLTESLWSNFLLSVYSYNNLFSNQNQKINYLNDQIGIATCIDLRDKIGIPKNQLCWGNGNLISILSHTCKVDFKDDTIGKIGEKLRISLENRIKKGDLLSYFLYNMDKTPINGSSTELSNLGPIFIKDPIKDVFMKINYQDPVEGGILSLLSWSVVSKERNNIVLRMRYQRSWMKDYEADLITRSVKFALENLPPSMKVVDSLKEIQKFQQHYYIQHK